MKKNIFVFILLLCELSFARGGDSVGNGGVIWSCRSRNPGHAFQTGILTDLFEAKEQYGLTLIDDPGGNPFKLYEQRKEWLRTTLPDMHTALSPRFLYVEEHRTFVNAELLSTRDFNNAIRPLASTCLQGEWQAENIANFREEDQQVLISAELWNSEKLPTLHKAALLFHEAIYYWMRTYYGSTDSDKSRKLTGILFSNLALDKMKKEITKVLGSYPDRPEGKFICTMRNSKRNQVYVSYGSEINETSLTVRQRCQNDPDANWCLRSSIDCAEISSSYQNRCEAENASTRKIYTGQGRNILEAQFNAHMACYVGSQAQGASTHQCPDFVFMECN